MEHKCNSSQWQILRRCKANGTSPHNYRHVRDAVSRCAHTAYWKSQRIVGKIAIDIWRRRCSSLNQPSVGLDSHQTRRLQKYWWLCNQEDHMGWKIERYWVRLLEVPNERLALLFLAGLPKKSEPVVNSPEIKLQQASNSWVNLKIVLHVWMVRWLKSHSRCHAVGIQRNFNWFIQIFIRLTLHPLVRPPIS